MAAAPGIWHTQLAKISPKDLRVTRNTDAEGICCGIKKDASFVGMTGEGMANSFCHV